MTKLNSMYNKFCHFLTFTTGNKGSEISLWGDLIITLT